MTKEHKDKYIAYIVAGISLCCYLCAFVFHDIPSYEQEFLEGSAKFLHWSMVSYLPLFPFLAGVLVITISQTVTAIAVTTTNFFLTLLFTIFACSSGILSTSWIFLSMASLLIMLTANYDKHTSIKIDDKSTHI